MSSQDTPKWTKQYAGFYTYGETNYAVVAANCTDQQNGTTYTSAVEWAVVRKRDDEAWTGHNVGVNEDWFDTMKEARAEAERYAAKAANTN